MSDLKPFRFDLLREGDTCHSRSDKLYANVIAYAEAWGPGRDGRKRARAAVRDPMYPNHSLTIHESWGQRYAVEASPRGYVRGNLDDYRGTESWIVGVYRWRGYENPVKRELCAMTLERWARKATSPRYDWWGAIGSSPLGRFLFPRSAHSRTGRLFCSEGALYCLVICGLLGPTFAPDTDFGTLDKLMAENKGKLPKSRNPVDLMVWQASHPEFDGVNGLYE